MGPKFQAHLTVQPLLSVSNFQPITGEHRLHLLCMYSVNQLAKDTWGNFCPDSSSPDLYSNSPNWRILTTSADLIFFFNLLFISIIIALKCFVSFYCTTAYSSCLLPPKPLCTTPILASWVVTEAELGSLCFTAASHQLSVLHILGDTC